MTTTLGKRLSLREFALAALVALLTCTAAWAQATAQLSGTVKDESGGVLPGVSVTATQIDTGSRARSPPTRAGTT
jgi:hypothetical protein